MASHLMDFYPLYPLNWEEKLFYVDVEVVDAPLDYNLLLGQSWFYAMTVVAS
jgi:hypothetical protein